MQPLRRDPQGEEIFHLENELAQIELLLKEKALPQWQCAALKNRHMELCRSLDSLMPSAA